MNDLDLPVDNASIDDLEQLTPAEYNPRMISGHDFKSLVDSIGKFGDMSGLVFNRRTGNIVGGHQRREAYLKLGGKITITQTLDGPSSSGTVAYGHVLIGDERFVYRVVDWDLGKEKIANIAANRIQGEWDDDKLAQLLYSIKDDINLPETGFTAKEITEVLATVMDVGEDDADLTPPDEGQETTKFGDIFDLGGSHRLMCGDSTDPGMVRDLMDGQKAHVVFTDPPYNVDYMGGERIDWGRKGARKILNDKMKTNEFYDFLSKICKNLLDNCDGAIYICMGGSELHTLHKAFTDNGGHWQTYIIWGKQRFVPGRRDYQNQYEFAMYGFSEEEAKKFDDPDMQTDSTPILYGWSKHEWYGGRKQGDLWLIERPAVSPHHPTEKPVTLSARAIRNSSKRGEIVLDLFAGSGSTLVASEQLERKCFTMELDPRYCDVIIRRWEHLTGKKAKLIKNVGGKK